MNFIKRWIAQEVNMRLETIRDSHSDFARAAFKKLDERMQDIERELEHLGETCKQLNIKQIDAQANPSCKDLCKRQYDSIWHEVNTLKKELVALKKKTKPPRSQSDQA